MKKRSNHVSSAVESCLRMDMRAARIASTQAHQAAKEIASNELYRVLRKTHVRKTSSAPFWLGNTHFITILSVRIAFSKRLVLFVPLSIHAVYDQVLRASV